MWINVIVFCVFVLVVGVCHSFKLWVAPGEVLVVASGKYEGWRSTRRAKYDPHVLAATHPGHPNHPRLLSKLIQPWGKDFLCWGFKSLEVFRLGKIHFHLITILSIRCPPKCQSTSPMSHYLPWTCLHKNPNTLRAKTTSSPNKRHSCENFGSLYQSFQAANFASFYHFITYLHCESNQTVQTLTISS